MSEKQLDACLAVIALGIIMLLFGLREIAEGCFGLVVGFSFRGIAESKGWR